MSGHRASHVRHFGKEDKINYERRKILLAEGPPERIRAVLKKRGKIRTHGYRNLMRRATTYALNLCGITDRATRVKIHRLMQKQAEYDIKGGPGMETHSGTMRLVGKEKYTEFWVTVSDFIANAAKGDIKKSRQLES